ncbi:MAG: DNA/RNA non-specific endonuclease [Bacteroidales bacterium]|nr:DNA/RNA non-specific endonuclease [Bacteroidales bacterium]
MSGTYYDGLARNYSYLYDRSMFTSMWIAYPLYASTYEGTSQYSGSWASAPDISTSYQINVWSASYNVIYGETSFVDNAGSASEFYGRGHQIPDADRQYNSTMVQQTYYAINSTPQIQNGFNGSIWSSLENAVRTEASKTDTLYVATGASFDRKDVSGEETVTWITPKGDPNKSCPVPNYYWKVLLKVKRSADGTITGACAIGFWMEHKPYTNNNYASYAVSVDAIEAHTGFDLFTSLPGDQISGLEATAEANSSWSTFQSF